MKRISCLVAILVLTSSALRAQNRERTGMNMPPGENVIGKVTAISKDSLTITLLTGGDPITVKIGDSTRIMKEHQPAKLGEIKNDETIFARGKLNGNVMEAAIVAVVNPEMAQRMQQGEGPGGAMMRGGFKPEDMGKKFIVGEVKAINETKLTIARPDGQTQDIEVDENTSFKKGAESITLPDIKVGDFVRGRGELKDSVFVPKELIVGRPQMRIMTSGPDGTLSDRKKPDNAAPASATPPPPPK
ncbi:MAG: DUF5666 domain-containing protein [Candidatus Angelobacter sp.]